MPLLEVDNLCISLDINGLHCPVVNDISFNLDRGEILGIVGESGCGKSITALAIIGLLNDTPMRITGGKISFDGHDLSTYTPRQRRQLMGNDMAMIFQEPMKSFNPVYRIGEQLVEALQRHQKLTTRQAYKRAQEMLKLVRIPKPESRINSYPHQLSGGMLQRVMIAMALANDPKLLIADEPTTALDVTVQAQILDLIIDIQRESDTAVMLISHDLGVIAENCDHVAVMYRGEIIEGASSGELFSNIRHPYTEGLMNSIPTADRDVERLFAIEGRVPLLDEVLPGCAFAPRCPHSQKHCSFERPTATVFSDNHHARCHFPLGGQQ